MKLSELPLNPFDDNVVFEPREAEQSVPGLNEAPLATLIAQFERVEAEPRPCRKPKGVLAQLVTSAEPGYGKSHLIGRLFRKLQQRTTQVYLRPFQDSASSWRSILLKIVQELSRANDEHATHPFGRPTQLDAFAIGLIAHLFAAMIEKGRVECENPEEQVREFRESPLEAFGKGDPNHYLVAWVRQQFGQLLLPFLRSELRDSGIALNAPERAWLQVLISYAFGDQGAEQRDACLEWFKGETLSPEERFLAGLNEREQGELEELSAKRNSDAFERLHDFLALAGFYRPFLFCFDQTELFTSSPDLVAEFGAVIDQLVSVGLNQLIVVTANVEPWEREIRRNFQAAYRDRFTNPIQLHGINQQQAVTLAKQRLASCGVDGSEIARFCAPEWFDSLFSEKKEYSVRDFLRVCARHCADLSGAGAVAPEHTLEEYFQHYEREIRSKPQRQVFAPDILRWSVSAAVSDDALDNVTASLLSDRRNYFSIAWQRGAQSLLFGFEDSSNWQRWDAIIGSATLKFKKSATEQIHARMVFFRTSDQKSIPQPTWRAITAKMEAAREYFSIHVIDPEDLITIYASYDLYANVVEGNVPFGREEMLSFVQRKLKPWWSRLLEPSLVANANNNGNGNSGTTQQHEPLPALTEQIRAVVSTKLFLGLDQLTGMLGTDVDSQTVLAACRTIPEVKIFSTSQATALKWQSSRSQ